MSKNLNRRSFLTLVAGGAAGVVLTSCGATPTATPQATPTKAPPTATPVPPTATKPAAVTAPTAVPPTAVPPTATAAPPPATPTVAFKKGEIRIMKTTVKLPTDKVTFRWLDSGDTKAVFVVHTSPLPRRPFGCFR